MLNSEQEIWKPVKGYEGKYFVSSLGKVANNQKVLSNHRINSGYVIVSLTKDSTQSTKLIHRIVAEAFLDNPDNKPEVNHKDGVKTNNRLDNLEWCTSSENKRHALDSGLKVYNKPSTGIKLGRHSEYYNVTYDRARGKWTATIRVNSKNMFAKRFDSEHDAALHVNWIIDKLGLVDRPKNIVRIKA